MRLSIPTTCCITWSSWSFNGDLWGTLEGADIVMEMYQKGELEQVEKGYQGMVQTSGINSPVEVGGLFPPKKQGRWQHCLVSLFFFPNGFLNHPQLAASASNQESSWRQFKL